jgi:Protein of unknown function (DUF2845)
MRPMNSLKFATRFKPFARFIAACGAAVLVCSFAHANSDGMRCGNKLVTDGDTLTEVRAKCGEPENIERHTILQSAGYDLLGRRVFYGNTLIEVPVELWTYNLGPFKLMRRIHFVDGVVDDIEVLGYGYNK